MPHKETVTKLWSLVEELDDAIFQIRCSAELMDELYKQMDGQVFCDEGESILRWVRGIEKVGNDIIIEYVLVLNDVNNNPILSLEKTDLITFIKECPIKSKKSIKDMLYWLTGIVWTRI